MSHKFFDLGSTYLVFGGKDSDGDRHNPWGSFYRRTYTQGKAEILVADKIRAGQWDWYQIVWGRNFDKPVRDSRTWRPYKKTAVEYLVYIDGDESYQFEKYKSIINSLKLEHKEALTVVSPSFAGFNQTISVYCMGKEVDCVELTFDSYTYEDCDAQLLRKLSDLKINEAVYYGSNLVYNEQSLKRLRALKSREVQVLWYHDGQGEWKYLHTLEEFPTYVPAKTIEFDDSEDRL